MAGRTSEPQATASGADPLEDLREACDRSSNYYQDECRWALKEIERLRGIVGWCRARLAPAHAPCFERMLAEVERPSDEMRGEHLTKEMPDAE